MSLPIPDFGAKASNFLPLSIMLAVGVFLVVGWLVEVPHQVEEVLYS